MSAQNKRKRSLSPVPRDETTPLTRSDEIYLDDGNIILVAEHTAFRVHKSQLARRSDVFRDMFLLPGQPQDAETFDECPVVRLSDSCEDLVVLLHAVYGDPINFDPETPGPILSVLRLSTKYLINYLRVDAIKSLAKAYPDHLALFTEYKGCRPRTPEVIKVAHEVQAHILLPAAYYHLCSEYRNVIQCDFPSSILEKILFGKEEIAIKLTRFVINTITTCAGTSCTISHCKKSWADIQSIAHSLLCDIQIFTKPEPLIFIEFFITHKDVPKVCPECRKALEGAVKEEREKIWTSLPAAFNLGTWEELRKIAL